MQVSFPFPVKLQSSVPRLEGLRFQPFTNIDGETFAKPALNGFWRLDMTVLAHDMQSHLALSSFITQMSAAGTTCVVPVCTQWRPNDQRGRRLTGCDMAPLYMFDHVGFMGEPFDGFTLRAAAAHRASYIDVNKPSLSQLWPGHFITLGDRLHQVVNTTSIGESETAIRVSIMPSVREAQPSGAVVIVDQLRLKVMMETGDQIGLGTGRFRSSALSLVEAF
ncbi:hypothetical protein [Paracoccus sp. pheM1]|uniref:hypothetical protein n=1 Tax=Paracoccus sp. pheM1 TaxID=2831675 RepID=UPI001BDB90E4|nr:hypothetical protein [Paracoccus sp. pheM1]MBT0778064.1 hypothetical protein [Paracoccus sp. pheM1]